MPFDEDEGDLPKRPNSGLKNVSSKQSIVSQMTAEKNNIQNNFEEKVDSHQKNQSQLSNDVNQLTIKFQEVMADKTLRSNKNTFTNDIETQFLKKLLDLAEDINNDEEQSESKGCLIICALLLKNCIYSRDRVNQLEYQISELKKTISQ